MAYENFDTRDVTYQIGVMRAHQEGRQIVAQRRRRCGNQKNEEPKACSVPRWNWDDWEYFIRDEETAIRPHANELARMVIAAAEGFLHGKTIERCRWDDKKWAVVIPIDWDWTNYCYRVRPNEVPEQAQQKSPRVIYVNVSDSGTLCTTNHLEEQSALKYSTGTDKKTLKFVQDLEYGEQ